MTVLLIFKYFQSSIALRSSLFTSYTLVNYLFYEESKNPESGNILRPSQRDNCFSKNLGKSKRKYILDEWSPMRKITLAASCRTLTTHARQGAVGLGRKGLLYRL